MSGAEEKLQEPETLTVIAKGEKVQEPETLTVMGEHLQEPEAKGEKLQELEADEGEKLQTLEAKGDKLQEPEADEGEKLQTLEAKGDKLQEPEAAEGVKLQELDTIAAKGEKEHINEENKIIIQKKMVPPVVVKDKAYPPLDEHKSFTMNIISKYLSMAMEGKNRQALLLQDQSICGFLILCVKNKSPEIVESALQVFELLIGNRYNISVLQKMPEFMDNLRQIAKNSENEYPFQLQTDADEMLQKLLHMRAPLGEQSNAARNVGNNPKKNPGKRQRKSETVTSMNRSIQPNGKETILFLDHAVLHKAFNREKISSTLIKVKGIISVTFNLGKNTCIIRSKLHVPSENFAHTLANLGFEVFLVYRNEKKEEVMMPVVVDKKDGSSLKENFPEYLPEEDEVVPVDDNACERYGSEKTKTEETPGMLATAKNFLAKSFFW